MTKQSPPPYSSVDQGSLPHPDTVRQNALLNQLTVQADIHHGPGPDADYSSETRALLDRETERIRNMLEYTLAVDYQGYPAASISAADRHHFYQMAEAIRQLRSTIWTDRSNTEVRPTPQERQVLAAFFWRHLHEPCKALSLPLDTVVSNIIYLGRYTDHRGD